LQHFISLTAILKTQKEEASMRPLKEKVSITLDSDIVQKIKDMAEADDRSFSQYINMVLKEHLQPMTKLDTDENCDK
jgi:hypothetical protein